MPTSHLQKEHKNRLEFELSKFLCVFCFISLLIKHVSLFVMCSFFNQIKHSCRRLRETLKKWIMDVCRRFDHQVERHSCSINNANLTKICAGLSYLDQHEWLHILLRNWWKVHHLWVSEKNRLNYGQICLDFLLPCNTILILIPHWKKFVQD